MRSNSCPLRNNCVSSCSVCRPSLILSSLSPQVATSLDIKTSWYDEWFHGGLQYQVEHHLFPRVPRCHLKRLQPVVQDFCRRHGIVYNIMGFVEANLALLATLGESADVIDSAEELSVRAPVFVCVHASVWLHASSLCLAVLVALGVVSVILVLTCTCVFVGCLVLQAPPEKPASDGSHNTAIAVFKESAMWAGLNAQG